MTNYLVSEAVFCEIAKEIDDFRSVVFDRLLLSFSEIDSEAEIESYDFLHKMGSDFDPDLHDEGLIYDDAYFMQMNYKLTHYSLKQDFLNLSTVWLYHIFERCFVGLFGGSNANKNKPNFEKMLEQSNIFNSRYDLYDFKICNNWLTINQELRLLANSVKHGFGQSFTELNSKYPNLIVNSKIIVKEVDIHRYIFSMKSFWNLALKDKFVTVNKDIF